MNDDDMTPNASLQLAANVPHRRAYVTLEYLRRNRQPPPRYALLLSFCMISERLSDKNLYPHQRTNLVQQLFENKALLAMRDYKDQKNARQSA